MAEFAVRQLHRGLVLSGHTKPVNCCAVFPDCSRVVSGSWDHSLKIWRLLDGTCLMTLKGHTDPVSGCCVFPDGRTVVSASWDNTLRTWDVATGNTLLILRGHSDRVGCCCTTHDGSRILSSSDDSTVCVWNALDGALITKLMGHTDWVFWCCTTPDDSHVISTSKDKTVKVWNLSTGEAKTLEGHTAEVMCCTVSPDGKTVVTSSEDKTLCLWNLVDGSLVRKFVGHSEGVVCCCYSHGGSLVISGSTDQAVCVWRPSNGELLVTLSGHRGPVLCCCATPDDQRIITGSCDNTLSVWERRHTPDSISRKTQSSIESKSPVDLQSRVHKLERRNARIHDDMEAIKRNLSNHVDRLTNAVDHAGKHHRIPATVIVQVRDELQNDIAILEKDIDSNAKLMNDNFYDVSRNSSADSEALMLMHSSSSSNFNKHTLNPFKRKPVTKAKCNQSPLSPPVDIFAWVQIGICVCILTVSLFLMTLGDVAGFYIGLCGMCVAAFGIVAAYLLFPLLLWLDIWVFILMSIIAFAMLARYSEPLSQVLLCSSGIFCMTIAFISYLLRNFSLRPF
ncbi:DNA gyrase subunit A [Pelomyxa schiedti]|nr:DNA gyrase subunit A [Pelomyxa schiedti]